TSRAPAGLVQGRGVPRSGGWDCPASLTFCWCRRAAFRTAYHFPPLAGQSAAGSPGKSTLVFLQPARACHKRGGRYHRPVRIMDSDRAFTVARAHAMPPTSPPKTGPAPATVEPAFLVLDCESIPDGRLLAAVKYPDDNLSPEQAVRRAQE